MSKRCCAKMCFNSQTINKDVTYFGFPKYDEFALKWAIAAGRPDLLEKKLNCITKYYLCSEHFTKDCFQDAPKNTRLKKTINPVNIPIPSIFKCNIDRYIPNSKKSTDSTEYPDEDDNNRTNDGLSMEKTREGMSLESLSVFHDHYNYLDMSASFLNNMDDIAMSMNDLSNENSFDNIAHCDTLSDVNTGVHVCRLCAKMYLATESLIDLSAKPNICKQLNDLIPNLISIDDKNLPRAACTDCLDNAVRCIKTLGAFKEAQKQLRKNYDFN